MAKKPVPDRGGRFASTDSVTSNTGKGNWQWITMAVPLEPICALVLMWHRPHGLSHYAENTLVQLHHFQQGQTFVVQMGKGLVQKEQLPECALASIPSLQLSLDRSGSGLSQQSIVLCHN